MNRYCVRQYSDTTWIVEDTLVQRTVMGCEDMTQEDATLAARKMNSDSTLGCVVVVNGAGNAWLQELSFVPIFHSQILEGENAGAWEEIIIGVRGANLIMSQVLDEAARIKAEGGKIVHDTIFDPKADSMRFDEGLNKWVPR